MTDNAQTTPSAAPASMRLPPDDPARMLTVASPRAAGMTHVAVAGDVYTILISGAQSGGRYCLIDMHIPPNGGPPPHRHDFEEMFTLLEGELVFTFRDQTVKVSAGSTVNIPANAPHCFRNVSAGPAHMLCMATPAGLDEFFMAVGDRVAASDAPPPTLSGADMAERMGRARALAATYRTELLVP